MVTTIGSHEGINYLEKAYGSDRWFIDILKNLGIAHTVGTILASNESKNSYDERGSIKAFVMANPESPQAIINFISGTNPIDEEDTAGYFHR
jgi:hypothetical protein